MRKILVLRGGALGDFIVTLPALALLRRQWPAARVELVGNPVAAELGRARGYLDAVHSQHEARWAALFSSGPLPKALARWLREFDLVINYWPDPEGELRLHFPLRQDQAFLSAPALPERNPAAAHYCEPLRTLGLEPRQFWIRLDPLAATTPSESTVSLTSLADARGYSAIHPGSGSSKKNWPKERWLELIPALTSPILLVLGPAEAATWGQLPGELRTTRDIRLAVDRPLEELISILSKCELYLGHDSGISHLAAACAIPCVLLFGPTEPAMWAPPAPQVRVIRNGPEVGTISVEAVKEAIMVRRS